MVEKKEEDLTIYNSKKIYSNEIVPLINQIKIVCAKNNLPFFCTCPVINTEEETRYETDGYFTGSSGINLKKDHIVNMIKVLRGVELKPIGRMQLNEEDIDYISESIANDSAPVINNDDIPVNNSWFEQFYKNIYSNIDDRPYKALFPDLTVSGTSIKTIISILILREIFNINDDELLNNIVFNPQYKKALGITKERPKADVLNRFRVMCVNHFRMCGNDLLYDTITGLSTFLNKLDYNSEALINNIKDYTYLRMLYRCNERICQYINSSGQAALPEDLKYYTDTAGYYDTVIYCEPRNVHEMINKVKKDSDALLREYSDILFDQPDFQNLFGLTRSYSNSSVINIPSNDASEEKDYEGYQVVNNPVAEEYSESSEPYEPENDTTIMEEEEIPDEDEYEDDEENEDDDIEEDDETDDEDFGQDIMNDIDENIDSILESEDETTSDIQAEELESDGPNEKFVGRKPNEIILEFEIDREKDCIAKCPKGKTPSKSHYDIKLKKYFTTMRREDCETCPNREECKAKIHKRVSNITFSKKSIQRLLKKKHE